jgi:serine/threonine-protein kinase
LLVIVLLALIAGAALGLPKLVKQEPNKVTVPNVVNKGETRARSMIGDAKLTVGKTDHATSSNVAAGKVISQNPDPDEYVAPGSKVNLVISSGKPKFQVPYVAGMNKDKAQAELETHFTVRLEEEESDQETDSVIRTDPAAGSQQEEGGTVTIYYATGPKQVPDVVGFTQAKAEAAITAAGFEPDVVLSSNTTEPSGSVISQSPAPPATLPQGSTVTLVVSTYVPKTPKPKKTQTDEPTPTDTPTEPPPDDPGTDPGTEPSTDPLP